MSIKLTKGSNVDLAKEAAGTLTSVRLGLGWDARRTGGEAFDLDASVVGLAEGGLSAGEDWFVYYNRLQCPGGAVVHQGDNLTGDGDGDDEQILVDLTKVPAEVAELLVAVTIHEAAARGGQNFGLVNNAYVRVSNEADGVELARYDLSEDGAGADVMVFGKLYRKDGGWKFKPLGDPISGGMQGLINTYKIG